MHGGGTRLNREHRSAGRHVRLVAMVTGLEITGAIHYPAARLDRFGSTAAKHQVRRAVAVDGIHQVVHDHVVKAGGDRFVLRFGQHAQQEVTCLGGQPGAVVNAKPAGDLSLVCAVETTGRLHAETAESLPPHHRLAPVGRTRSRFVKYVPEPATRFTSRPGYSVISACAVSIPVLPPPMIHTGVSLARISSHRMSQKSGDTDTTRSLEISSGSLGTTPKPYALINRFASTTTSRPAEDLPVIRTFPSTSSSDSITQPKSSSTCTRCLMTLRQCSRWSSTSPLVAK